jgi:hypothetical protein
MPRYLPQARINDLVELLASKPSTSQAWITGWFSALETSYRNDLPDDDVPSSRLRRCLSQMNQDPPLPDGSLPLVTILEVLTLQPVSDVVDLAKQLLSAIGASQPPPQQTAQQMFGPLRLACAEIFADRDNLRTRLAELVDDHGPPALVINGAPRSGKSHTRKLIAHVAQTTGAFRLAWVEIQREQAASMTPDWLVEDLVRSLVPGAGVLPPERTPILRWIGDLESWAVQQLSSTGDARPVWMVIDGVCLDGIHDDVKSLVERLAIRVATPTGPPVLKLVLIDCDYVAIVNTRCVAEEETMAHLGIADAHDALQGLLSPARFDQLWPGIEGQLREATTLTTTRVRDAVTRALP